MPFTFFCRHILIALFVFGLFANPAHPLEISTGKIQCDTPPSGSSCPSSDTSPVPTTTSKTLASLRDSACPLEANLMQEGCSKKALALRLAYKLNQNAVHLIEQMDPTHAKAAQSLLEREAAACREQGPIWKNAFASPHVLPESQGFAVDTAMETEKELKKIEAHIAELEARWPDDVIGAEDGGMAELLPCHTFLKVPMAALKTKAQVNRPCGAAQTGGMMSAQQVANDEDPVVGCVSEALFRDFKKDRPNLQMRERFNPDFQPPNSCELLTPLSSEDHAHLLQSLDLFPQQRSTTDTSIQSPYVFKSERVQKGIRLIKQRLEGISGNSLYDYVFQLEVFEQQSPPLSAYQRAFQNQLKSYSKNHHGLSPLLMSQAQRCEVEWDFLKFLRSQRSALLIAHSELATLRNQGKAVSPNTLQEALNSSSDLTGILQKMRQICKTPEEVAQSLLRPSQKEALQSVLNCEDGASSPDQVDPLDTFLEAHTFDSVEGGNTVRTSRTHVR